MKIQKPLPSPRASSALVALCALQCATFHFAISFHSFEEHSFLQSRRLVAPTAAEKQIGKLSVSIFLSLSGVGCALSPLPPS